MVSLGVPISAPEDGPKGLLRVPAPRGVLSSGPFSLTTTGSKKIVIIHEITRKSSKDILLYHASFKKN